MRFTTSARDAFQAVHEVEGHSVCGRVHSHAWQVSVSVEGGLDPKKVYVVDHGELEEALRVVIDEFRDGDLNDMLPGVVTTPEGVALYIRERLVLQFPRIGAVTVDMGPGVQVTVFSDPR